MSFQSVATIQRRRSPTRLDKELEKDTIGVFDPYLFHSHSPSCPYCGGPSISDGVALGQRCIKGLGGGDMDMMVMTRRHKCKTGEHREHGSVWMVMQMFKLVFDSDLDLRIFDLFPTLHIL